MLRYSACERNKQAILEVLQKYLKPSDSKVFVEFASGSGEHTAHFAPNFPLCRFQPTEVDQRCIASNLAYKNELNLKNVLDPIVVDLTKLPVWKEVKLSPNSVDIVYNANTIHISSNAAVEGLFKAAGQLLKSGGLLLTYGPFAFHGKISPDSNVRFDQSLRSQNAEWGYRDVDYLEKLGSSHELKLVDTHAMPANNYTLVWSKK